MMVGRREERKLTRTRKQDPIQKWNMNQWEGKEEKAGKEEEDA